VPETEEKKYKLCWDMATDKVIPHNKLDINRLSKKIKRPYTICYMVST